MRRLVARRTGHLRLQRADREEIVSAVLERIAVAWARRRSCAAGSPGGAASMAMPLGAIVSRNVDWAVVDFCRLAARHGERERLTAPDVLPQPASEPAAMPAEQVEALSALMRPLNDREREILFERYVFELTARDVAARHGMRTGAVQMACTRASRKVRETQAPSSVGFLRAASVSTRERRDPVGVATARRSHKSQGPSSTGPGGGSRIERTNQ